MAPQAIAHYRITSKLGQRGMGEVYRATDTRLGRDVALKILPASLARDPERMARFERAVYHSPGTPLFTVLLPLRTPALPRVPDGRRRFCR